MKKNIVETYKSDKFKDETAGYIDTDGSFIYAEEYHGEEYNEYKDLGLPEFSSTHWEEEDDWHDNHTDNVTTDGRTNPGEGRCLFPFLWWEG